MTVLSSMLGGTFIGYSGISGYSGYSGISGYSGVDGASGTSGYSGWSGISGYSGIDGASGTSGYSGWSGISGYSGADMMQYPASGVAISTGTAWGTSKTAPTGDIVGTTDTQSLSNKTLSSPSITGSITFSNGSTQSVAGASTGKAIAMAIVFGG